MAPHMAKTYAIRKAFSLLKSENYDGIVIESDCWQVETKSLTLEARVALLYANHNEWHRPYISVSYLLESDALFVNSIDSDRRRFRCPMA
ncbi:hypothetical protein ES332_A05G452200v1 [Gossypium tomentosum]|uniref:Uncharacterized protein n=1 Tax=Gossypium tomentosum TaxID=34277 RepID=A0A5D2QVW7_GOSTO|nr:hypothetical protein ES332_A05G452200v1 [Gossypium tomentosum]